MEWHIWGPACTPEDSGGWGSRIWQSASEYGLGHVRLSVALPITSLNDDYSSRMKSTLAHPHASLSNNTNPHRFESKLQRLIKASLSSYWPPIRRISGPRMNPSNLLFASWIWFSAQLNLNSELNHESTSLPHKSDILEDILPLPLLLCQPHVSVPQRTRNRARSSEFSELEVYPIWL